jgi:hypothetical protein
MRKTSAGVTAPGLYPWSTRRQSGCGLPRKTDTQHDPSTWLEPTLILNPDWMLDQVVRFGKTFSYGESGPKGLLSDKKVYVFTSRGGAYAPGTPTAQFDFQEPYLRHILAFIGLTDVTFIHAENQGKPELALAARDAALQKIEAAVAV